VIGYVASGGVRILLDAKEKVVAQRRVCTSRSYKLPGQKKN